MSRLICSSSRLYHNPDNSTSRIYVSARVRMCNMRTLSISRLWIVVTPISVSISKSMEINQAQNDPGQSRLQSILKITDAAPDWQNDLYQSNKSEYHLRFSKPMMYSSETLANLGFNQYPISHSLALVIVSAAVSKAPLSIRISTSIGMLRRSSLTIHLFIH